MLLQKMSIIPRIDPSTSERWWIYWSSNWRPSHVPRRRWPISWGRIFSPVLSAFFETSVLFNQFAILSHRLHVDHIIGIDFFLVLQPMPTSFEMHLFCIWIVEATLTKLTEEGCCLSCLFVF